MDAIHINGMVRALGNPVRSRKCLERYWRTRMALVWTVDQVHMAANERKLVLTQAEAITVLKTLHDRATPFKGLDWFGLIACIEENGLGRDITPAELKRFLQHNVITRDPSK